MQWNNNSKVIAKNTLLLYFRMIVTMIISLYTSRVILHVLGITDYGIYQAVGGIVGFLSFVNHALSVGSSRYISYGLGENNIEKLRKIFSSTLTAHIILAIFIIVLAESVGLWFLYNKLNIPHERLDAAVVVFHLSVVTAFFSLTQVPYHACIVAYERFKLFAYISVLDSVLKLSIVYAVSFVSYDKLYVYALLLCLLQIGTMLYYRVYCRKYFDETNFKFGIDKAIFKEVAGFSGWSLFASSSIALNSQGILILLNMFFSPAVVAARALSIQINMAANQLMSNFQTAATPKIVKLYAAKNYEESKKLLLQTTRFSYYLMLLMSLPICLAAEPLMEFWLGNVPEYSVPFLQIIIIQSLFQVFDTSFYRALYAKGQLRENALLSPMILFAGFPVVYFLFVAGYSPVALSWVSLIAYAILGIVIKPILIIRIADFTWKDIWSVFAPCINVTIGSFIIPLILYIYFNDVLGDLIFVISLVFICIISVFFSVWFLGISKPMRCELIKVVKSKCFEMRKDS